MFADVAAGLSAEGRGAARSSGRVACSITAAERGLASVLLLEATSKTLEKVRISGGGRCNVTHACWDPSDLVTNYPRGKLSLLGSFSRFSTGDAVAWFADRGVDLFAEEDGRMFPESNSSSEVVACLQNSAEAVGVKCLLKSPVNRIDCLEKDIFLVHFISFPTPKELFSFQWAQGCRSSTTVSPPRPW